MLITGLCSYGTPIGVTELILMQILYLFRFLVCCIELILITDLFLFRTPVGAIELILKLQSLYLFGDTHRYHRDYGTYTGIAELILVLRIFYWYYGTCTCLTDLILVLRNMYLSYGSYTELILVQKYP